MTPIEQKFWDAVCHQFGEAVHHYEPCDLDKLVSRHQDNNNPHVSCTPQVKIGKFRADFVFVAHNPSGADPVIVIVECDGHAFHEKTKSQAARDKQRDRLITERGAFIMRFTGSEIYRNPIGCAEQVYSYVMDRYGAGADHLYEMHLHEQKLIQFIRQGGYLQ